MAMLASKFNLSTKSSSELTRYRDLTVVLRHAQFVSDRPLQGRLLSLGKESHSLHSMLRRQLLFLDGEEHQRLQTVLLKPLAILGKSLRGAIQEMVDELLTQAQDRGSMDVVADFAAVLPLRVIVHALGVPVESEAQLQRWTQALGHVTSGYLAGSEIQHVREMLVSFRQVIGERGYREDGLLGSCFQAFEQGLFQSEDDLVINAMMLLSAGSISTAKLIAHGLYLLLGQEVSQIGHVREELAATPALIKSLVEELLRLVTPTRFIARWAKQDIEIGDTSIAVGQKVILKLEAANHDPEIFPHPQALDLHRGHNPHLAFGGGAHLCPGAALARSEAQMAFTALFSRFPALRLAPGFVPELHPNVNLGGITTLPVLVR